MVPGFNQVRESKIEELRAYAGNSRIHSTAQVRQIARSIEAFGFTNPILISDDGEIIAGHGRFAAAKLLGLEKVPTIALSHLGPEQRRAYLLADNKLALEAGWDEEMLGIELQGLLDLDFDLDLTGFSAGEVDLLLEEEPVSEAALRSEDRIVPIPKVAVTRPGDLWLLGEHRLLCGNARAGGAYRAVLGNEQADLILADPPYNMAAAVRGRPKVRHRPFAMAAGEMPKEAFERFLSETLGHCANAARSGAIAFVFIDWRNMGALLAAGAVAFSELKNVCVWNKTNAGLGTFYRSKHELVFVFKAGSGRHVNNFGLGRNQRYRTNVWDYPGITSFGENRAEELGMHPTVKPFALIRDAIKDCSKRGQVVLDPFGGSGTTLIAAATCGRRARLIEIDPSYCDAIVERFRKVTGVSAILNEDGRSFADVAGDRAESGREAA